MKKCEFYTNNSGKPELVSGYAVRCSECDATFPEWLRYSKYCPHCGARVLNTYE